MLLIVMASVYLAAEPAFYRQLIQQLLPSSAWEKVDACLKSAVHALRFWLLSRLVSMTAIGLIVAAGLWLLEVPLAGTLGIIAALLTLIPNIPSRGDSRCRASTCSREGRLFRQLTTSQTI
jgi:predicted PurR-regulated permease PerM